jgi:hypothetical protein
VFCCGLRVISVDGSVTDAPDTAENAAFFGRPSNATWDGAFPQVRWVAAAESGTGALTGAAFGPYTTGEQTLALDLLPSFGPGMLVLADRNFLSHALAGKGPGDGRAHLVARLRLVRAAAGGGAGGRHLPGGAEAGPRERRPAGHGAGDRVHRAYRRGREPRRGRVRPAPSRRHFPPDRLDLALALATFLLKILSPQFAVRDRPGRTSPRKTKKAGDFPRRGDHEPSVTHVTRRIEFHCLEHL